MTGHAKALYNKMNGDFYRYIAEVSTGEARQNAITAALQSYEKAFQGAKEILRWISPIRLNVSLNCAIFEYEFQKNVPKAIEYITEALEGLQKEGEIPASHEDKDEILLLKKILTSNLEVNYCTL